MITLTVNKRPLEIWLKTNKPKLEMVSNQDKINLIKSLLPKYYGLKFGEIDVKSRRWELVIVRHTFAYLTWHYTTLSLKDIGELFTPQISTKKKSFGALLHKDHSSIISSRDKLQDLIDTEKPIADTVSRLESDLASVGLQRVKRYKYSR